jgi:LacI family transcriptional regulator, galactose operon repressor
MTGSARPGTAKAVAELAGVSVTTVSRVLSGQATAIPPETQDRVLAAARELRYRPNSLARALRKGTTQSIGLIVPDISDAYFHQVARGVEDVAQAAGCVVILTNTDRVPGREEACVNLLLDKRVDGIVFAGGGIDDDSHLGGFAWGSTRVITIGPHQLPFPSITVDDATAISDAVHHLAEVSCRRVLCLAGQPNWLVTQRRLAGYRRAVRALGLADDPDLVAYGDFTESAGAELAAKALVGTSFDGVIAFNDYTAIGAMHALEAAGLRVPQDVAVVGCDDVPVARMVHPALSSIGFSQYEFGRKAAEMILSPASLRPDETVTFPHELVRRRSTDRLG